MFFLCFFCPLSFFSQSEVPRSSPIAPAFSAFEHATGKEVARQLTLMDHRVFSCVAFEELHAQCWLKQPHMAPNVRHLILEFSRLSMWMAYSVVREFDLRARTAVLAFLVDVGYQCLKLGNFHGAALVAAVLATPPLRRLKKTLGSLPSKVENEGRNVQECHSHAWWRRCRVVIASTSCATS